MTLLPPVSDATEAAKIRPGIHALIIGVEVDRDVVYDHRVGPSEPRAGDGDVTLEDQLVLDRRAPEQLAPTALD